MKFLIMNVLVLMAATAFAKSDSVYTSVAKKDCKSIEDSETDPNAPIDYYTGHCKGQNGYTVVVSGGDIRYDVSLLYSGRAIQLTQIGSFHDMGADKVEWRGAVGANGQISKFDALIYRLNVGVYNVDTTETVYSDILYVARLNGAKSCIVGKVSRATNMNEQARKIADNAASLPCIEKLVF